MEDVRMSIARNTGISSGSIAIWENGRFEIRNIPEFDANRAYAYLMRCEDVRDLSRSHRYDFSHIDYLGRAKVVYSITGRYVKGE